MVKLFYHRPALPSGLWGNYQILTKADRVRFKTVGALDTELVFSQAVRWAQFQQQIKPGHVVSDREIASVMMSLLPDENESVREIRLRNLVQWELGSSNCVNPEQASQFGSLITREFLNELNSGNSDQRREYNELTAFLSDVRFRAGDGEFHAAQDLLIKDEGADNRDEPLRAAFAREDRLLNDDYIGSAIEFFKACRSELNAPPQLMAEWAVAASSSQTRHSVLEYILNGQLRREVASEIIQEGIEETWLRNLATSPLLTDHFDRYDQSIILGELRSISPPIYPSNGNDADELPPPDPNVLHRIYEWWIRDEHNHISQYKESVYGDYRLRLSNQPDWEDSQTRESWLTLFMLGAFQTMGRVRPQQHRSFLERCRDNGWLQVFASPRTNHENREAWVEILEHFLDQSGEIIRFYHWMRQFVSIVQFANWLQDYGDAFFTNR